MRREGVVSTRGSMCPVRKLPLLGTWREGAVSTGSTLQMPNHRDDPSVQAMQGSSTQPCALPHPWPRWIMGVVLLFFLPKMLCGKCCPYSVSSLEEEGEMSTVCIFGRGAWIWWQPRCAALLPLSASWSLQVQPQSLRSRGRTGDCVSCWPENPLWLCSQRGACLPCCLLWRRWHVSPLPILMCTSEIMCHLRMGMLYFEKLKDRVRS